MKRKGNVVLENPGSCILGLRKRLSFSVFLQIMVNVSHHHEVETPEIGVYLYH